MAYRMRIPLLAVLVVLAVSSTVLTAQTRPPVPQPFPRPRESPREVPPATPEPPRAPAQTRLSTSPQAPTEAALGMPIYPGAVFLTSYDAGRSQRYYLFGTNVTFDEIVNYYKIVLDTRGDLVFEAPATHMFEVGRFREALMAFPPGVTVKDYTWNGSEGYLNPHAGVEPARFRTVVQIVPPPPGARAR